MTETASYTWTDNWATIPDTDNGRTHGVCVTKDGRVIVFHQAVNGLLTFDPDGKLISAVGGERWLGAHGMTLIEEDGQEFLWLADQTSQEVAKVTLDGETVQTIDKPDLPMYVPVEGEKPPKYVPTWVAQNPVNGEIWVANGYGSHVVHRYAKDGTYMSTLDGTEGAGKLREPHGINFRLTDAGPELWVTDRASHRIQVFDGEGTFLRSSMSCHSPCCFDFLDDQVVVPELFTGVKILDATSLEVITEIGHSDEVSPNADPNRWWPPQAPEGWPNLAGTDHVRPEIFNSPHGACFAPNGDIYVVEWILGGRITKLVRS